MLSLKEEARAFSLDETEDLWHTLSFAEMLGDQKALGIVLEALATQESLPNLDEALLQRIQLKAEGGLSSNKVVA